MSGMRKVVLAAALAGAALLGAAASPVHAITPPAGQHNCGFGPYYAHLFISDPTLPGAGEASILPPFRPACPPPTP